VTCLDCFREYCTVRLHQRQFEFDTAEGYYTLSCPAGCSNSFIREIHHFHLLSAEQVNSILVKLNFFEMFLHNTNLYLICSMRDIRDSVRKNMFYVLVAFCVQDQIVEWVLYHLRKMM